MLKFLGGFALAAALLWWVLRGTDPGTLWVQLGRASWAGLLAATALNLGHNVFRILRWRALLDPVRPGVPFRPMFTAVIVGYMTSWVIPGRIGELVRPMLLSARQPVPLGPCIGSIVADRVLDAAAVVTLFSVGLWITPLDGQAAEYAPLIRASSVTLAALAAGFLAAMLVVSAASASIEAWLDRRGRLLRWIGRSLVALSSGARAFRSPRLLALIVVHSLLAWGTISLATWIGVQAAGARVPYGVVLVILPMLALGVALPTPGGAGGYHGAMKFGLMIFGVAQPIAVAAGLLMHAVCIIPVILLGMLLLWVERISWKEMVAAARQFRSLGSRSGPPVSQKPMESLP